MQANLNKTVTIEAENAWCYHLKVEKRTVDPRDPTHPRVRQLIRVLDPDNYKRYFQCSVADNIEYLKVMGWENVELIHDPTIERYVKIEFPATPEHELREEKRRRNLPKKPSQR